MTSATTNTPKHRYLWVMHKLKREANGTQTTLMVKIINSGE